ncbi:ribokinase [Salinicoccus sesuvii]|uniref:Ribokinase n=1 Tax=Salinicoccus sesuvii TaxID=868281 RepID=A0ABV7N966_9STAP
MDKSKITVIGSINMDLVTVAAEMPEQGETVRGESFETLPGGKGANQAVAAARLGGDVRLIGKVGDDPFGATLKAGLVSQGVYTQAITVAPGVSSGLANIIVSDSDNRIIIIGGANEELDTLYVDKFRRLIGESKYVLLQFEVPKATIEHVLTVCETLGVPVIINPAPAMQLEDKYWEKAAYITPNDHEAKALFAYDGYDLPKFHEKLIITNGSGGATFFKKGERINVPAHRAEVKDTTGAGDTFNGALAVALSEEQSLEEAVAFANRAASLSIQKLGAQSGMPNREAMNQ